MDRSVDTESVGTFLVERYWPGVELAGLRGALLKLEAAADAMSAAGQPVWHVGSILMPDDQVVFSLVAAGDVTTVRELNERAGVPADRIAKAIALLGDSTPIAERGGRTR